MIFDKEVIIWISGGGSISLGSIENTALESLFEQITGYTKDRFMEKKPTGSIPLFSPLDHSAGRSHLFIDQQGSCSFQMRIRLQQRLETRNKHRFFNCPQYPPWFRCQMLKTMKLDLAAQNFQQHSYHQHHLLCNAQNQIHHFFRGSIAGYDVHFIYPQINVNSPWSF